MRAEKEEATMSERSIELVVNGQLHKLSVQPRQTLLEVVRKELKLTGTKEYCGVGICGACTVLVEQKAVSSCLMLAVQVAGRSILTIEGLAQGGKLHPIQRAFIERFGFQCGYCTPGMILMAKALLDEIPHPTEAQIRAYMGSNICRCTGYQKILESVQAAQALSGGSIKY